MPPVSVATQPACSSCALDERATLLRAGEGAELELTAAALLVRGGRRLRPSLLGAGMGAVVLHCSEHAVPPGCTGPSSAEHTFECSTAF